MNTYKKHLDDLSSSQTALRKIAYIRSNFGRNLEGISKKGGVVLEIGPGRGECVQYLNSIGIKKIDVVDNDRQILTEITSKYQIRKNFLNNNIVNIDQKLEKYDAIIGIQVLEHMPVAGLPMVIKTLYSHLKKGGWMLFVVPNAGNPLGIIERYGDWQHTTAFTEQSLKDLVAVSSISGYQLTLRGYEIPPNTLLNLLRIITQKLLHAVLLLVMVVNGGTYFKIMTPNIILEIKKN